LQILASAGTFGRERPRTAASSRPCSEGPNRRRATAGTSSCGAGRRK
jgi:hypothetical protein